MSTLLTRAAIAAAAAALPATVDGRVQTPDGRAGGAAFDASYAGAAMPERHHPSNQVDTDAAARRLLPGAAHGARAEAAPAAAPAQVLPVLGPIDETRTITFFIAEGTSGSGYRPSDRDLAIWALQDWERGADGAFRFAPAPEDEALVRVHFVAAQDGQYGEMRSVYVKGRRGAAVYVRPDTDALGPDIAQLARQDALLRDTIVYLTCLHELGHALGLSHTSEYRDIMYFFGFGGDVPGFFDRYRRQLRSRDDIARVSGLSAEDVRRVRMLYPAP